MTGPDTSAAGGPVILATVFALNRLTARARERLPWLRRLLEPEPTDLAGDGAWLDAAVRAQDLDEDDLAAALRQHAWRTSSPWISPRQPSPVGPVA